MTKPKASFLKGCTFTLHDKYRGEIEVSGALFVSDLQEYRENEQLVLTNEMYSECIRAQKEINERRHIALSEYSLIQNEMFPAEMKELRRKRALIPGVTAEIEQHRANLNAMSESFAFTKKRLTEIKKTLSGLDPASPAYRKLKKEYDEEKNMLDKARKRAREKIAQAQSRLDKHRARVRVLEQEKFELLAEKKGEIEQMQSDLCRLGQRKKKIIHDTVGNVLEIPYRVVSLIKADPDITEETYKKILALTPGHIFNHDVWEIDSSDPLEGTLPLITLCIEDNLTQSMADLVIRVSQMRGCQFIDSMVALYRLRSEHRLCYFRHYRDGSESIVAWEPPAHSHNAHDSCQAV